MKNKSLFLISMFVILLFVVSCAPKMSDEELSVELSKLSPEELEAVTSEDSGTFAGMAKASPKLTTLRAAYQSSGLKKASGTKDTSGDVCGDGKIKGTEQCDGTNLGGSSCNAKGFDGGSLYCDNTCKFDTSKCNVQLCGNKKIDSGETCDDGNIKDDDGCDTDCHVDTVNGWECSGQPSVCKLKVQPICGNGKVESYEECDGADFGGSATECSVKGLGTGSISCTTGCKFDFSKCVQQQQQACTPGQYVCDSVLYVKQCNHLGEYNTPFKCAEGEMCNNGNCVASLQKPDLVVSNVSFSLVFNTTSGKNDVMYNVTLKNIGTVNSGFFSTKVQPMVSGVSANFFSDAVAAGKESSRIGIYQGELICPGTHTLNVTADINWQVAESNEYNNQFWPFPVVTC